MPPSARKLYEMPKPRPQMTMVGKKIYVVYDPNETGGDLTDMVSAVFSSEELATKWVHELIEQHNSDVMPEDEIEELKRAFDRGDYPYLRMAEFDIDVELDD